MDVTEQVGAFLRRTVAAAREAIVRDKSGLHSEIEIEVKLGHVLDKHSRQRVVLPILSETVLDDAGNYFCFESNMSRNQHATLNQKLNGTVRPGSRVAYVHLREEDIFYAIRGMGKVRKTVTKSTNETKCIISKRNVANLQVFLPSSRLDYRVSVNVEKHVPSIDPIYQPEFSRTKDRLSYKLAPFQVDLTQVRASNGGGGGRGDEERHEVEVEVTDMQAFLTEMDKEARQEPNAFLDLVNALLNNL
ncbi:Proteasome subunit alpha type-6 [Polyrhizophydium stewartii]|uniref:mRNA-capping enzyme subunit beta n=1 Tax=Polyrhizophydium stewartii TaxID=2732419 RepID=A0ABR4N0H1_9FUNG